MLPLRVAALAACALAVAACTTPNAAPPSTQTPPSTTPPPSTTSATSSPAPTVPPPQPDTRATTVEAQRATQAVRGPLGLQDHEAACLTTELDANPQLLRDLGTEPVQSPRYADLATIAQECIRRTTGADTFASTIGAQFPATSEQQLVCLRDHYIALQPDQIAGLYQAGLNPGTTNPAALSTLHNLLRSCGLDPTTATLDP